MLNTLKTLIAVILIAGTGLGGVLMEAQIKPVYEGLSTNGLVLHYKMDEASWNGTDGEVRDSIGTNNGTSYKGALVNPGKFENSADFNGVSYVLRASSDIFNVSNSISVSLWGKVYDAPNWSHFATKSGPMSWYVRRINTSKIEVVIKLKDLSIYFARSTYSITRNSGWVHIVFTYDSVNDDIIRLYINGVPDGVSIPLSNRKINTTTQPLYIGSYDGSTLNSLNGGVDDFRIYNRALTTNEISQLSLAESYSKRRPLTILQGDQFEPTGLSGLALWLDASDTSTLYDAPVGGNLSVNNGIVGRWVDKSGNGNHATNGVVANMPKRSDGARNGRTGILFDTTDFYHMYKTASFGVTTTVFYVMNTTKTSGHVPILGAIAGDRYICVNQQGSSSTVLFSNSGNPSMYWDGVLQLGRTRNDLYLRGLNTAVLYSLTSVNLALWDNIYLSGYTVNFNFSGDMYDILIYNRVLSTNERVKVEKYLSAKWAVPLNNIVSSDSTMDQIEKVQTPVRAVYVGTNRVYRFKNRNYPRTVQ